MIFGASPRARVQGEGPAIAGLMRKTTKIRKRAERALAVLTAYRADPKIIGNLLAIEREGALRQRAWRRVGNPRMAEMNSETQSTAARILYTYVR